MKQGNESKGENRVLRLVTRVLVSILILIVVMCCIITLIFALYVQKNVEKNVDETIFTVVGTDSATELYYYDRNYSTDRWEVKRLTEESLYGGYHCVYVEYNQLPENLIQAFVSIEDKRFYSHNGVDWRRTIAAFANYFLHFNDSFGGSTITQQLIKNVTDKDDYSFQRKIQEIFWAMDLETKMDKEEIITLYLNIINLSQGCYGVQAAAEYYFSKDVSELTLNECACIAAITNNPSYYDPLRNPEHNFERKNLILDEMYEQGYITEEEWQSNVSSSVVLKINSSFQSQEVNSWYVDMVVEDVIQDLMEEKGYSRVMANLVLYTGGLKIYTAMDPDIQDILEDYYADTSHFYTQASQESLQSSMIVIDPTNGDILGVVGAIGEKQANRLQNFATQTLRPAGSVIKPLSVYAPALENGIITWSSVYDDVPVNFGNYNLDSSKGRIIEPVAWPKNANGVYRGLTNINYAIEHSINTVTVRVLEEIGVENSFRFLYDKLHIENLIDGGYTADGRYITDMDLAALALGQLNYGVTVREITAAYSIFANQGIYHSPRSYYRVTDALGSVILDRPYQGEAVISEDNASIMNLMLENVVKNGTANTIALQNQISCAGKTGTTQNNFDRWYIGYTPYMIGGVWYGYEYPKALSGSNICVDIWDDVSKIIHERTVFSQVAEEDLREFSLGSNVIKAEFCADSGKLVTKSCEMDPRNNRVEQGYFTKGTEPTELCDCHVPVAYDTLSGGIASESHCPESNRAYVGLIHVVRSFPIEIYVTDAQYVWRDLPSDIMPETSPALPFFYGTLKEGEYCGISRGDVQFNRLCRMHFDYAQWKKEKEKISY
ncbi:MAG: transglycosylase domain-containing protein [Clostridia bacterium]|nr:transglycosylase domain-containing protein [Clostridia bacterium]